MSVKVSSKYQVVIPEEVRHSLGITPGMEIDVIAKGGIAYLVPIKSIKELQAKFAGTLSQKGLRDKKDREV